MIKENIDEILKNINDACKASGRDPAEVTLLAVSKTKPVPMLQEAYAYGIRDFGENYVQELTDKISQCPKDIKWHMIGHLQRNKVKYIVGSVSLIHSVDSLRLAEEISRISVKKNVCSDILIEVNVAEEDSKFGITVENAISVTQDIAKLSNIRIRGLMTSAPYVENAEDNRKYFKQLKQLYVDINTKNIDNVHMDILSMGMTNDYIVAIEEGATLVRVGTGIFGARNYNKL